MSTFFRNEVVKNVGTTPVKVIETNGATRATVIGLSFTNLTDKFVYVNVELQSQDSARGFYLKDSILPSGTSLRAVSSGEKLILATSNAMYVSATLDDSVDVIISYVEIT
jgi:hypothetical protein